MKWLWIFFFALIILGPVVWLCTYLINQRVISYSTDKIKQTIDEIPSEEPPRMAIVYGARVYENNKPSSVLYDRIFTAVELYRAGKVKKLLLSGAKNQDKYDEPTVMKKTALELGVPEEDIVTDFAGHRTFETCRRAGSVYEVKKAIHITQRFHLPRAIYLGENMGIDSIGLRADRRTYLNEKAWVRREFFAVLRAWFNINFALSGPVVDQKEPIK